MIDTALSINGQDCTSSYGNTPEEYEAIAVTLFRVAQAIRDREHGIVQCLGKDGPALVSVIVHNRELSPDGAEVQFPIIETLHCGSESESPSLLRNMSCSLIDQYRLAKMESL
jgi:hypothetical protein